MRVRAALGAVCSRGDGPAILGTVATTASCVLSEFSDDYRAGPEHDTMTRRPLTTRAKAPASLRRLLRCERGTAVVEFALVVIPLTLIVFGILDFGRALNYYNDLTQLSGQGARAAAVNENVDGTAASGSFQQLVAAQADSPELKNPSNHLSVCVDYTSPLKVGDPVKVTATYQFHFIPLVHSLPITLTASQTERYESSATPGYAAGACSGP